MTIDLKQKSLNELKVLAYDLIAEKESAIRNLQIVNQEIELRLQQEAQKMQAAKQSLEMAASDRHYD